MAFLETSSANIPLQDGNSNAYRFDYPEIYVLILTEPPRDCRRLNILREYDDENTKLHS